MHCLKKNQHIVFWTTYVELELYFDCGRLSFPVVAATFSTSPAFFEPCHISIKRWVHVPPPKLDGPLWLFYNEYRLADGTLGGLGS